MAHSCLAATICDGRISVRRDPSISRCRICSGAANDWSIAGSRREKRSADSAAQTARDAIETLSSKLTPALATIWQSAGIHRLRIAPDGMLNLVPFSALSDGRGHFLVERFATSYVSAGRDLVGA